MKRIVLGNCSHWWHESGNDGMRATSPRVCTHAHDGTAQEFVVGKSPQGLDLVHVAYVDPIYVLRAVEFWPEGSVPS